MKIHPLWEDYPSLKTELERTLDLMETSINLANKEVENAILEMIHSGGKLLRPAYLFLFSQFGKKKDTQKTIALAASIETLHTATLIHDDIVDEAATRRSLQTIQHKFGKDVAVYAGDYLFIVCFKLLAHHVSSLKSIQLNANSMEKILDGELGQMDDRYDYNISVESYIKNISGKTAELFSLSCFLGAFENNAAADLSSQAKDIGLNIGIAFQILDDILDYSQNETTIGKPVLKDVRQGIYSLPLICAMTSHRQELMPYLDKKIKMSDEDTQKIYDIVKQADGITKARILAEEYTQKALEQLSKLPETKENTRETLIKLTTQLLNRQA
ncbi:polyprenyl synthetase family protein [Vagococcus elongatus]|uniref:Geranylgeranyl pyrophosphate synthase n=1 Tax=Vagococcus elongatus TaxID=180344 RepID=A0A430AV13_9ENTE|nr:polyprenyl synthetase family protein [Vagococcus elongatus]RSU11889.1 geranylgeranyl pyrophosphate synthase [Vagococcus elongatus]